MGRLLIITGATAGIGRQLALRCHAEGERVIAVGRDRARLAELEAACGEGPGRTAVRTVQADLSDLSQVAAVARAVREPLDGIVHCAGLLRGERTLTPDGHELQLAVHHLAVARLTGELLDRLVPAGQVVTVASDAHRKGAFDFDDLPMDRSYSALLAYRRSKLAAVAWSLELARRAPDLRVYALHPGVVDTDIGRKDTGWLVQLAWSLMAPLKIDVGTSADRLWTLLAQEQGPSGVYYSGTRLRPPAPRAADPDFRARLWQWTWSAAGLPGAAPERIARAA